eukprot:3336521-Karenia_brevis.AAC.1
MKEALSYDTRIVPSTHLRPLLDEHETAMRATCTQIIGKELDDASWARMQLPGPLAGCGLRIPSL